jgi:hypothetical protein
MNPSVPPKRTKNNDAERKNPSDDFDSNRRTRRPGLYPNRRLAARCMNKRPIKKRCIDCNSILKNRSKGTKRCMNCHLKHLHKNKTGRITGVCISCGQKLSAVKNKTGKCFSCSHRDRIPWNKGIKGLTPWNKGKSSFKSKEEYAKHYKKRRRELRAKEPIVKKIPDKIRTLIRNSLSMRAFRREDTKTEKILGCSIVDFIKYLESKFEPGMQWENYGNGYGKWNIDHIIPISKFNLTNEDEILKAFNYKNCQPMMSIENIKKGNKIVDDCNLRQP